MESFFLRTESIKPEELKDISVISSNDEKIIEALVSSEPCLLEGARGTGKSFLMKLAEMHITEHESSHLPVFLTFSSSSLIDTDGDPLQFYHWMLAKTLKALFNQLRKNGYVVASYATSLLSNDTGDDSKKVESSLKEIVKKFEKSYQGDKNIQLDSLPDIEDVRDAIEEICIDNGLERICFFFDEAAHVFRPEQQRQFFTLFKDLRSPYITCNAAIYPGVTHFGNSFEPIHDSAYLRLERNIKDESYLAYFKDIVFKQATPSRQKELEQRAELFNTLALASGGNPRMLLRTIQEVGKLNTSAVNKTLKNFYRERIWDEHTELGDKYTGHKKLIDWGRDFLEKYVIPAIERLNDSRKERQIEQSSIYFWLHKDAPETIKEALRLLTYTGIIRKFDGSVRATRSNLGTRYEVKYGCIVSLESNPHLNSKDFFNSISLNKFPEFGDNHSAYFEIKELNLIQETEQQFKISRENIFKNDIDVLEVLTPWQKDKLRGIGINTLGELYVQTEQNLIDAMYNVGPYRARYMKRAVDAELLEYLSG